MLEMGVIVGVGLLATLAKLPWRWKLWVVSNPIVMDIIVFILLCILHWGTFSGVMVASIGALFCSLTLSGARLAIGHVEKGNYVRGWIDIRDRLVKTAST